MLAITNAGPSVAHSVSAVARPSNPTGLTYGPYRLGDLNPGETELVDLAFRRADDTSPLEVILAWSDTGGEQSQETEVEPPPPPPLPAGTDRHRR